MRRAITPPGLTAVGLGLVLAVIVVGTGWGVFHTDIKPELYLAPGRMWHTYLSAWTSTPYLGSPNFNVGLAPVAGVLAVLRATGLSAELTFTLFHLVLWLVAAWGAGRLLRTLLPGATRWAGLAAGVAYLANPYTVTAGATLAIALPLALLPWQSLVLVKALREPASWRWPALFGLTFFAMSGMNVAVVPLYQLLMVVPVTIAVRHQAGLAWRTAVRVVSRCALVVVGVSLYWLVPGMSAIGTGTRIVEGSETLGGIARVSSFTEVLRGLGMWSLYGHDAAGPWVPQFAPYLVSSAVIIVTLLWPVLALLALGWAPAVLARLAALGIALAAVVMVGLYPGQPESPFGLALRWVLESVPTLAAFRTTNKVGSVLALSFALLIGYAVGRLVPLVVRTDGLAPVAGGVAAVLVVAWALPAFTGNLYISPLQIPSYWTRAADAVNAHADGGRTLLLPGQTRSHYRWSEERPDDLTNSLFTTDAVIPETTPNTSPPGANLLAALDDAVQSGRAPAGVVSRFARYLGANQVLLRHDLVWEEAGGARPGVTAPELSADPGLVGVDNFGKPGENTQSPSVPPSGPSERLLPPLQLYDVTDPRPTVRAESLDGQVVLAGDAFAIPAMQRAGLLRGTPTFRYAAELDTAALADALGPRNRLVLTDTNQRRTAITNRLTANQGRLLAADEPAGQTRTLGESPRDQTVLERRGATVSASAEGGAFFDEPYADAANAVDGDRDTAWLFGDFRNAPGTTLTVSLPRPRTVGVVRVRQAQVGSVHIDRVTISAAGESRTVHLPDHGVARVDLGGVTTSRVRLTVDSIHGKGYSAVGISELSIPGVRATRTARAPLTFSDQYGRLTPAQRRAFDRTPLDVLLTRVQNTPDPRDDTEVDLRRDVTLPDRRTFADTASVRVLGDLGRVYDTLAGFSTDVRVTSNAFYFSNPEMRASLAADGDPATAWVPGGDLADAWWKVTGPERVIPQVTVSQERGGGAASDGDSQFIRKVAVAVDGTRVATAEVGPGESTIALPAGTVGRVVRVRVLASSGPASGPPPRVTEIGTGVGVSVDGAARRCLTVATVDGRPLRMRPVQRVVAGQGQAATTWRGCSRLRLGPGQHALRPVAGIQLDDLTLRDVRGRTAAHRVASAPQVAVSHGHADSVSLSVGRADGPYVVVLGQGYDRRWQATLDGDRLPDPTYVDGYSTAWIITDPSPHTISIRFGPQRAATVALVVSLGVILVALAVALGPLLPERARDRLPRLRRRRRPIDPQRTSRGAPRGDPSDAAPPPTDSRGLRGRWWRPPRWVAEVGLVVLSGVAVGLAGVVAATVVVGVLRWTAVTPRTVVVAGAAVVLLAGVLFVALLGDARGQVSADAVQAHLWPHRIAGAGLVAALAGALVRARQIERRERS